MKKNFLLKIIVSALFIVFGYISLQITFSRVLGSNTKFTLFDFLAPSAGAFLGTLPGILSLLLIQLVNIATHGFKVDIAIFIRLFPALFAAFYFSKKRTVNLIIPLLAIVAFNLHPVGRSAWQYSLFWLIPIIAHFFRKNLFVKSLGATFTAHAIGSSLFVWALGLTREMWLALIPQTAMERLVFSGGICLTYLSISYTLGLIKKIIIAPSAKLSLKK